MKLFLIPLFAFLCAIGTYAQDKEISSSFISQNKALDFEETKGTVIKIEEFKEKKFKGVISQSSITLTPKIITNIRTNEKVGCIDVWLSEQGQTGAGTIDYDEIPACIEALEYIINNELPTSPSVYTRVFITTRDGVTIGATHKDGKWKAKVMLLKYVAPATITLETKMLKGIVEELKKEAELLESKL